MGRLKNIWNAVFTGETQNTQEETKVVAPEVIDKTALNTSLAAIVNNKFELWGTENETKNPYQSNYVIYRGISMLAQNIAKLPLVIYRGKEPLDTDFILPNFDIQSPNAEMSLYELMYQACVYYWYRGEFMVYINLDDPRMILEPVNPTLMQKQKDGSWKWNNKKFIPKEQLIYVKLLNPDGDRGLSPVDVVKAEILSDSKSLEYNNKFFENFGQIGGTLYDDKGDINTTQMRELVNEFDAKHKSSGKAYKTLGLPHGIKYEKDLQTMKEMQFLESRRDIRDKLLGVLGIHKAVFGVTDSVDRAVAETARKQLWSDTLHPNAIRIQEKLNQQFFKVFFPGYSCRFDFNTVSELKADKTERLTQAGYYKSLGYTTNEINEQLDLGMDEIDDTAGTIRVIETKFIPLDDYLMPLEEQTVKSSKIDSNISKIVDLLSEDEKTQNISKASRLYVNKVKRLKRRTEKKMSSKVRGYFSKQLGKVLAIIKTNKSISKASELCSKSSEIELRSLIYNLLQEEKKELESIMKPLYEEGSVAMSELAIKQVGAEAVASINTTVVEAMTNKISGINNHTYALISKQIQGGLAEGETIDQIGKRITNVYKFNTSRARTIARTETSFILNRTAYAEYHELGITKKQWSSGAERESHIENGGEGVVGWGHVYNGGLRFPGDSGPAGEVINCTCTIIPIVERG